jgi:two-component system cell cycle response regulator DivK
MITAELAAVRIASLISDEMIPRAGGQSIVSEVHPGPLVLIVEDDQETRQLYVAALNIRGFRTDDAHNGLQALEKALAVTPDLVLADIAVPGIDGIELCRRLRADRRTRNVPVLAVTGYEDRYRERALSAGADRVLVKPCEPETLAREVRELIALRRVQVDAPGEPI